MKGQEYKKKDLIGKTKDQIKKDLGQDFNYYHSSTWIYIIKAYFWGRKEVLIIFFNKEGIADHIETKIFYGKINLDKL